MKNTIFRDQARWSEWLESMRKDVECVFGILRGRFRILKAGIRMHGVDVADSIWLTCCALHNWLLEKDGHTSEWDGNKGLFDEEDNEDDIPFALRRLVTGRSHREYDSSGMGAGHNNDGEDDGNHNEDQDPFDVDLGFDVNDNECVNQSGINLVKDLSSDTMRDKLVTNFNILFQQNKIQWPRR